MKIQELKDLEGRSCVALESGSGRAVKLISIFEKSGLIVAKLETLSTNGFLVNRIQMNEEPFLKEWWDTSMYPDMNLGKLSDISTKAGQIHRKGDYVYFGNLWGDGVRLFFSDELVNKILEKEESGLENIIKSYTRS